MSSDKIRAFEAGDLKTTRFLIGTSLMSPLAVANSKAYTHPLTIAVWLVLVSIMIQLLGWWPTTSGPAGKLGLLSPIPAFGAVAVPVMFFFDWLHRPIFEEDLQKALAAPDMTEPQRHYARTPASGFYILEHKGNPVGLIALDASESSERPAADARPSNKKEPTAKTAIIRHFHIEEVYRASGVQSDLLEFATTHAFASSSSPSPRRVICVASTLDVYKVNALRTAGFRPTSDVSALGPRVWKAGIGVLGWKYQCFELTKEGWRTKH